MHSRKINNGSLARRVASRILSGRKSPSIIVAVIASVSRDSRENRSSIGSWQHFGRGFFPPPPILPARFISGLTRWNIGAAYVKSCTSNIEDLIIDTAVRPGPRRRIGAAFITCLRVYEAKKWRERSEFSSAGEDHHRRSALEVLTT